MSNLSFPPVNISEVLSGQELADKLYHLIGTKFSLSKNPRTNGSTLRKAIAKQLDDGSIKIADKNDFEIIPLKKKGVPKLLACLADSYIVTTGDNYNLQVWNRFPNTLNVLVKYKKDDTNIKCNDIRLILVQIDTENQKIKTIVVATPQYIVDHFGAFGVPTMKYQLIITDAKRKEITRHYLKCLFFDDTPKMSSHTQKNYFSITDDISTSPQSGKLLSLDVIKDKVVNSLLGKKLTTADTKKRGQELERLVATLLGYQVDDTLVGGYPDIPNQLLEIKVQDSPTVDLGKYSPSNPVVIDTNLDITTEDVRYLIVLTDKSGNIEGVILCPGNKLGDSFTFVNDTSYKCQRSIPMNFFNSFSGKSVFNPKYPDNQ